MSERTLIPKLRFKGFDDEWNHYYLEDVIESFVNGQTPSRNVDSYWNGDIPWVSSGELNYNHITSNIEQITEEGQKNTNLKLIPAGTFLMAITGLEAAGTRGSCAILDIDATTNQSCMALFPKKDKLTTKFLYYWYLKVGEHYGIKYTQGTKQQSYNKELLEKLPIVIPPNLKEQEKITDFLSSMNHKIDLLEKKYDSYVNFKKYLMQQIFAEKLRFDFDDEWDYMSVNNIFKSVSPRKYQIKSAEINDYGDFEVIDQGQDEIAGYSNDKNKLCYELPIIIYGDHTTFVKFRDKPFIVGADGVKLLSPKINAIPKYLFYALEHFNIKPEGYKRHFSIIKKVKLPIPNLEEQNEISNIFSNVDIKIRYTQKQLNETKKFKKGLLQQMFV